DQVEQVLLLHQAADEEEDGDVRGDADRLPEAGVRVVGGKPAEVDATRPDLDVPDPLAGQLAGDAGGGGVDAGASPIEAAEQAPADRFERPYPVVAEVGDEMGVEARDGGDAQVGGEPAGPEPHRRRAGDVDQVGIEAS